MPILERLKRHSAQLCQILAVLAIALDGPSSGLAQRKTWQDEGLPYRRTVKVTPSEAGMPTIVVSDFFAHGAITDDLPATAVYARSRQVASRVLQQGPGDFFRIAFEVQQRESDYQIYYGGKQSAQPPPDWAASDGLLLETRRWENCNLNQLSAVRTAFASAEVLGADFVAQVYHRNNPFGIRPAPFFSHYHGQLRIKRAGPYTFFTSSQDCSFLLVDGKMVVSAPGRHRPIGRARYKGTVKLTAGPHSFEYWHAAAGVESCAVAAWQPPGAAKLAIIPNEAFGGDRVAHVPAIHAERFQEGPMADLRLAIRGDAPLELSDLWLVRAEFQTAASAAEKTGKCTWEFGDGQTSDQWNPTHIFLHPGPYDVTTRVRRRGKEQTVTNKVWITRPIQHRGQKEVDTVEKYLPLIDAYDPAALDARGALQLVLLRLERQQWQQALDAGTAALSPNARAEDDSIRWQIATRLAPVAHSRLNDSAATLELWKTAGKVIRRPQWRAACAVAAADVALNELTDPAAARPFLEFADQQLHDATGVDAGTLYRVWGDWYARQGDAKSSLAGYRQAEVKRSLTLGIAQQTARRGAYSRSAEAFLREGDLIRAWEQLSQWQQDFPHDKAGGYLTTLLARYWLDREKPKVASALAGDLLVVNPQSPYADRLVLLQAAAAEKLGQIQQAADAYQTLISDYPGSPLVNAAKKKLADLQTADDGKK